MPEDKPGESVKEKAAEQVSTPQPVNPESPPNTPPGPPAQGVAEGRMEGAIHAVEDRVKRAEKLMIGLTSGIVLLTLGLVVVGILQWRVMSGQLAEMRTSGATATDQIWQAIGNMNWMARTADGALKQTGIEIGNNQSARRLEMRPYMIIFGGFTSTGLPPDSGMPNTATPMTVFVQFKNIGKSIAKRTVLFYTLQKITGDHQSEQTERIFHEAENGSGTSVRGLPFDIAPEETTKTLAQLSTVDPFSVTEIRSFQNG